MFHTYPTEDLRLKKSVLRGLSATVEIAMIKDDLLAQGVQALEVRQLTHRESEGVRRPMPLFVVTTSLHNNDENKQIHLVERVCHHRVSVEQYRGPQGPRQCFNCQQFGHSSLFCTLPPVCFKCANSHKSADCLKPKDIPALCCNCSEAHPASYRKCSAFLRASDARPHTSATPSRRAQKKSVSNRQPPPAPPAAWIQPNHSFADVVNNINRPPQAPRPRLEPRPTSDQTKPPVWEIIANIADALTTLSSDPVIATLALLLKTLVTESQNGG